MPRRYENNPGAALVVDGLAGLGVGDSGGQERPELCGLRDVHAVGCTAARWGAPCLALLAARRLLCLKVPCRPWAVGARAVGICRSNHGVHLVRIA